VVIIALLRVAVVLSGVLTTSPPPYEGPSLVRTTSASPTQSMPPICDSASWTCLIPSLSDAVDGVAASAASSPFTSWPTGMNLHHRQPSSRQLRSQDRNLVAGAERSLGLGHRHLDGHVARLGSTEPIIHAGMSEALRFIPAIPAIPATSEIDDISCWSRAAGAA